MSADRVASFSNQPSPTPPPLPQTEKSQKTSTMSLKVAASPPGLAFEIPNREALADCPDDVTPPAGTYFFYGTLQDPQMLMEILDLESPPVLKPAYVLGYATKLWGQYPALVYEPGNRVEGTAFDVPSEAAAARLAEYEGKTYRPTPCDVRIQSEDGEDVLDGFTFMYCGRESELSQGHFDLQVWLKRMGR